MRTTSATAYPRQAAPSATPRTNGDSFDQRLGFIARRLRFSVPHLSERETDLIEAYGRGASRDGEARYRMVTFRSLCAIARRSRRCEDREALAELIREEVRDGAAPTSVEVAYDAETACTGPADVEQRAFEREKNPITHARCVDALTRQLATTRVALDATLAWKPTT